MGLFHKQPQPCISIDLDASSEGPLRPGQTITGTATLRHSVPRILQTAVITLFGHAVTHAAKKEAVNAEFLILDFASDETLFRISRPLSQNASLEAEREYKWNFEFVLPQQISIDPDRVSPYANETRYKGGYAAEAHILPPSFSIVAGPKSYAIVEYNLQAIFQFDGDKNAFTVQRPEPLIMLPPDSAPRYSESCLEFIKTVERYASSRLTGVSKSYRKSITDKFSSTTPSIDIVLRLNSPSVLTTGNSFTIWACAELESPSSTEVSVPSITLRIKELQLRKITHLRALRRNPGEHHGGHRVLESRLEEAVDLNVLPSQVDVQQQLGGEDKKRWAYPATFEARVPGSTCPNFSTMNICHSFRLRMVVEADICGGRFSYKVEVPDVIVLPVSSL